MVPYLSFAEEVTFDMIQNGTDEVSLSRFRGLASVDDSIAKNFMSELMKIYSSAGDLFNQTGILSEAQIGKFRNKYLLQTL